MTATAIYAPTYVRPRPLCDTRRAHGKHRAPSQLAQAVLAWSQRARGAWLLSCTVAGGVIAPLVLS
jgi:hypothetical protein